MFCRLLLSLLVTAGALRACGERIWQIKSARRDLGNSSGNASFAETMGGRIDLECAAQRPVLSFALPECVSWDDFRTDSGRRILGDVLRRAGFTDLPEFAVDALLDRNMAATNRVVNVGPRGESRVPTAIDQVRNVGNVSCALQSAARLPLAANLRIRIPDNMIELSIRNDASEQVWLRNTLRLPPYWKAGVVDLGEGELKPGETRMWKKSLGGLSDLAELRGGEILAAVQVDVAAKKGFSRLWVRADLSLPKVHSDRGDLPISYFGSGTKDVRTVNVPVGGDYWLWCRHSIKDFDKVLLNGEEIVFKPHQTKASVKLKAGANTVEFFYPEAKNGKTKYSFAITAPNGDPRTECLGSRLLWHEDFETTPCGGRLPSGLSSAVNSVTTNELCRWVQNADVRTGAHALAYDFSQLDAGTRGSPAKSHGWMAWNAEPNTNGWTVCRLSLKGLSGGFTGEIRGHFLHKNDPVTKKPLWWIAYWIDVDETFRISPHLSGKTVSIGKLVFNAWNDVELWLPTEGNRSPVAYGRVNEGPWVEMDLGGMVMKGSLDLMQIGGEGTSKWMFDTFSITREF